MGLTAVVFLEEWWGTICSFQSQMVKKLVVPLQRKVFAELNKPSDSVVLNKVVAFGYVTDSTVQFC
jgi:hypothetical protein